MSHPRAAHGSSPGLRDATEDRQAGSDMDWRAGEAGQLILEGLAVVGQAELRVIQSAARRTLLRQMLQWTRKLDNSQPQSDRLHPDLERHRVSGFGDVEYA